MSPRRVRALIDAGILPARRSGPRHWLVDLDAARKARGRPHPVGRRISARSSWAILLLAEGTQPDGLSASEFQRARQRLDRLPGFPPGALAARASELRYRAHPGILERLARDDDLVLGGSSAAAQYGADLIALDRVEAYIHPDRIEGFVARNALREANQGRENVLLRIPAVWHFEPATRVAPPAVVAVDLVDAGDDRSVRAGRALLRDILAKEDRS